MSYALLRDEISSAQVECSEKEYLEAIAAATTVKSLSRIEIIFGILARSYIAFETNLFNWSLAQAFPEIPGETGFGELHESSNLALLTILTAARSYHDQRPQILTQAGLNRHELKVIADIFSRAFDTSFPYRLMEALRNFAQHTSLPISGSTITRKREYDTSKGIESPSRQRVCATIHIWKDTILEHRDAMRAATMQELDSLREKRIDVRYLVRKYIGDLAECHYKVREETEKIFASSKDILDVIKKEKLGLNNSDYSVIYARMDSGAGGGIYVDSKLGKELSAERVRWKNLSSANWTYITSQLVQGKDTSFCNDGNAYIPD